MKRESWLSFLGALLMGVGLVLTGVSVAWTEWKRNRDVIQLVEGDQAADEGEGTA